MDEHTPPIRRNPRRRKRTKFQNFKEAYLPAILLALVVLLIVILIISSVRNSLRKREDARKASDAAAAMQNEDRKRLDQLADALYLEADLLCASYDYDGAIAKLDSFTGDIYQYDKLIAMRDRCVLAKEKLVTWNDLNSVPHLSLDMLIAEPQRTFSSELSYRNQLVNEHITVDEFSAILQQLYDNGYVLIGLDDILVSDAAGYTAGAVYLPEGKKPLLLTETNANYYKYLSDGDYDGVPDAAGAGFATKLVLAQDGSITCEMLDNTGATVTGAFDVVPVLNAFVEQHPDFSYRGAKATLAVTGYESLFGYSIDAGGQELSQLEDLIEALRASGYDIACYTYDHAAYGEMSVQAVKEDLALWREKVLPILGSADVLFYPKGSDIAPIGKEYNSEKYYALSNAGFRIFVGYCEGSAPWALLSSGYVRQGRLVITGTGLEAEPALYEDYFHANSVIDSAR